MDGHAATPGGTPGGRLDFAVPADLDDLATCRDVISTFLADHDVRRHQLEEVRLVVSELASNVIRHTSEQEISVSVEVSDTEIVLEMSGGPDEADLPDAPPPRSEWTGRGLLIAQGVADRLEVVGREDDRAIRCHFGRRNGS